MNPKDGYIIVGAYWPPRREPIESCAKRIATFLGSIQRIDPLLNIWFPGPSNKERRHDEIPITVEVIADELATSARVPDFQPDLGFRISLWNGKDPGEGVIMSCKCSSYLQHPPLNNLCLLKFFLTEDAKRRLIRPDVLRQILQTLVTCFDADWGAVSTSRSSIEGPALAPRVGWLTFLSEERGPIPRLPAPFEVTEVKGLGSVVAAVRGHFDAGNVEHVRSVKELTALLDQAGLLYPTPER